MKYKLFVFCPNNQRLINQIIHAASKAGAGIIGNYSHCAFVTVGQGNWKPEKGSNPTIGKINEISHEEEVRIEMICPATKAKQVKQAVLQIHPYETAEIDFIPLVEI